MNTIHIKRFGLAFGLTGAILYLGCIILMATVGQSGTVYFFNNLLHGLDTSSIIRMNVPFWEALLGIVEIFILGWLTGAVIASLYNVTAKKQ
ncbi:MAG: DUF5676 family membrane protein [Bacteroidales bacterium]|nr:DUF5676 family membrane protein [Bacteroidales bacterium]